MEGWWGTLIIKSRWEKMYCDCLQKKKTGERSFFGCFSKSILVTRQYFWPCFYSVSLKCQQTNLPTSNNRFSKRTIISSFTIDPQMVWHSQLQLYLGLLFPITTMIAFDGCFCIALKTYEFWEGISEFENDWWKRSIFADVKMSATY